MPDGEFPRPAFIDAVGHSYNRRGKRVILLTGNVLDQFWSPRLGSFTPLEQTLYQELKDKFLVLRVDAASGISFYDVTDEPALVKVCQLADRIASKGQGLGDVLEKMAQTQHQPLPMLILLRGVSNAVTRLWTGDKGTYKPLCLIMQFAPSLFPEGDFDRLSELDRQRLVTFLNWINDPFFGRSGGLILLVSDTKSEMNRRVLALPVTEHVEIPLPSARERAHFVTQYMQACAPSDSTLEFEPTQQAFVEDTAGLKLTSLEDLLETSRRTAEPLRREHVLAEVNLILEAELGDVVKVNIPDHSPKDIIGNEAITAILRSIFQRCDNPETAVSAVLVSGPNGGGKTFQMEAFAAESGRIVIELTGLRGMWFGQTDKLFERLRWHIATYGKVLILVDEAHTAFGSVHHSDTHETERRLAGNIIKMMGDPRLRGKVLWALMTSRPDELDPDVKSRAPLQIPIFDPEGEARQRFIQEMFQRRSIALAAEERHYVYQQTAHYSARDFDNLVREVKAQRKPVLEVLQIWQASAAIVQQRRLQTLIAALHCSYPQLIPEWLRNMDPEAIQKEAEELKWALHR
ncbi:MAG TPA: ATP-binding protein [Candidatus Tectomicrobia bacterium]|nr:ATP-binding protein [Candidatus Tectomicrobia bacterium]